MFITDRKIPEELLHYRGLAARSTLTKDEIDKIRALERGCKGESDYDAVLEKTGHQSVYVFRDIYLLIEGSVTQYDTLIVSESGVAVNEIKNFSGDYRYDNGMWTIGNYRVPDDAASQLRRAIGKLKRLQSSTSYNFQVVGKLVFPNEDFQLFTEDDRLWNQVVLRSNMKRYFRGFDNEYSGDAASEFVTLIEKHIVPNPYFKHGVEFDAVRKGLYCGGCGSVDLKKQYFHFICQRCESRESNETHIVRAMNDFKYLFGRLPMTTKRLMEFVGGAVSMRTLLRALIKYCDVTGTYKSSQYKFKYYDFDEAMNNEKASRKYKDYLK